MAEAKDRVLIIGATGYLGRRLVKASLALGHATFLLFRPETVHNLAKSQMFMHFMMEGAKLLHGALEDHESLVSALKQVDVVVSAIGGDQILQQLKLIQAIKEVGTIKRYLPSEFGMDVGRMHQAFPPGGEIFKDKRIIRQATEEANIPYTYVSGNCMAGCFTAGLAQLKHFMPPREHVNICGNGDKRAIWVAEEDIAMYTMLAISDPRTLNKVLYIRPPANILSQMEVVNIWEKLIGKELKKTSLSDEEWLSPMDGESLHEQVGIAHFYDIFYRGVLDFEVEGPNGVDSGKLYPDYKYVTVEEYLKRFV